MHGVVPGSGLGGDVKTFARGRIAALAAVCVALCAPALAQETVDLFAAEPSGTARRIEPPSRTIPGVSPDSIEAVSFFALSPNAGRSMRSGSAVPRQIRIALPEGAPVTCTFPAQPEPAEAGDRVVLEGRTGGANLRQRCDLVVEEGRVVGQIEAPSGRYRIVPTGRGGAHAVVKLRTQRFAPEMEPRKRSMAPQPDAERPRSFAGLCDAVQTGGMAPRAFGPIRILLLYTPAARRASADIDADIALMMAQMRRTFSAQGTGGNFSVLVELAHAQEINYVENPDDDMSTDLERLSDPQDPVFRGIPALRRKYQADFVHLLTRARPGDGCGIGWLNADISPAYRESGFSVSDLECAVGNYSFIHEVGHNLGMEHDREVVGQPGMGGNYGYVLLDKGVRSVMAYNNACQARDSNCERLPYFSTPNLSYDGEPFGRAEGEDGAAHNVETLCRAAPVAAGFRSPHGFASYESNDIIGRELARSKDVSRDECASQCEANGSCMGYSYDKWNRWCFLKAAVIGLRVEPKAVSGVRPALGEPVRLGQPMTMERYRGRFFPGKGYQTLRAASMEGCEAICRDDTHCAGFTHYQAQNRCEVFASLPAYEGKKGADSGVKVQKAAADQ